MPDFAGVYRITNTINGKFYIGSSINIAKRWKTHRAIFSRDKPPFKSHLYNAVKGYGADAFVFEVLERTEPTKTAILSAEQFYIDQLRPEYNILPTAGSLLGFRHSAETIARFKHRELKCAGWNRGLSLPDEHRQRLMTGREQWVANGGEPWNKGTTMDEDLRKKVSEGVTAALSDPEVREKMAAAKRGKPARNRGIPMSEEQKTKVSASRTGKGLGHTPWNKGIQTGPQSEETRRKISEKRKGIGLGEKRGPHTEEARRKMSEALRGKPKLSMRGRTGGNNSHGHFGLTWRSDVNKWTVRIGNKKYGCFVDLAEALKHRDEIVRQMGIAQSD